MARRSYRQRRRFRGKGRWSANINTIQNSVFDVPVSDTSFYQGFTLCSNPIQSSSTVSQQFTVKNIELSYELEANANSASDGIEGLCVYIMYKPQGMNIEANYPNIHPEYIMAYRFLGSPNIESGGNAANVQLINPGRLPSKIRTRMARRLQTGDEIVLLIVGINSGNAPAQLNFNGLVRWWTKAN